MSTINITPLSTEAQQVLSAETQQVLSTEAQQVLSTEAQQVLSTEVQQVLSTEAQLVLSAEAQQVLSAEAQQVLSTEAQEAIHTKAREALRVKVLKALHAEADVINYYTAPTKFKFGNKKLDYIDFQANNIETNFKSIHNEIYDDSKIKNDEYNIIIYNNCISNAELLNKFNTTKKLISILVSQFYTENRYGVDNERTFEAIDNIQTLNHTLQKIINNIDYLASIKKV